MAEIVCEGLTKEFTTEYGSEVAVDDIDVTIDDQSFVTIVGPSGCGKTTLLRMLSGLESPTTGEVYFDETQVTTLPPQDRNISMVFQDIALFPFKTVEKNILYGIKYTDMGEEKGKERVREIATMLQIDEHLDKKPGQLSGGQQQRVALARALIRDPDLFLLDEPMSDLDAQLKIEMRAELKKLHQEFPVTTVYVTHDQEEALTLSDKVVILNDGKVMQASSPGDVYENPENMFVAEFIGSPKINIIETRVEGSTLTDGTFELPITETAVDNFGDSQYIGIRPPILYPVEDEDAAKFSGTIRMIENYGKETVLHVTVPQIEREMRVNISSKDFAVGDDIYLNFDCENVDVFDGTTRETITNNLAEYLAQKPNQPTS
ncbi:ABC transporter ATP-binding protein [Halobellus marinus]|uniref:ABC transporter ATP-binding protein n=1 Tax=Halobellus TaxID=1073986 RepID=UPI0028AFBE73|nr:ABC transporter ATP-binding protein [Halobellus sp. DFY28]